MYEFHDDTSGTTTRDSIDEKLGVSKVRLEFCSKHKKTFKIHPASQNKLSLSQKKNGLSTGGEGCMLDSPWSAGSAPASGQVQRLPPPHDGDVPKYRIYIIYGRS